MAVALAAKRMARERKTLESPNDDYFVHFQDDNLFKFDAYIIGPSDSLYSHKFAKIQFTIPQDYPLKPPKCKFIQHAGGRIHPNLYVDGKVCLSILGTWEGEPWATAMTCETVLITIRSLLDNKPYLHEPGQPDNPEFNQYVQYGTWRWLLLDYLRHEQIPSLKLCLQSHVAKHSVTILSELQRQLIKNAGLRQFTSLYDKHNLMLNYHSLEKDLNKCIGECQKVVDSQKAMELQKEVEVSRTAVVASVTGISDDIEVVEVAASSTTHTDKKARGKG